MWISKKKYQALVQEHNELLNSYRVLSSKYELLERSFRHNQIEKRLSINIDEVPNKSEIAQYITGLLNKGMSKTQLCKDIGITSKTLDRVLQDLDVKPSTIWKIREYVVKNLKEIKI